MITMSLRQIRSFCTATVAIAAFAATLPAWSADHSASGALLFSSQGIGNNMYVISGDGGNVTVAEVGGSLLSH